MTTKFSIGDEVLVPGEIIGISAAKDGASYSVTYTVCFDKNDSRFSNFSFSEDQLRKEGE